MSMFQLPDAMKTLREDACFESLMESVTTRHRDDVETPGFPPLDVLIGVGGRPGGAAPFGEPFPLGYGLAAAALLTEQRQLRTHYPPLERRCHDILFRITQPREGLRKVLGKHSFFQSNLIAWALPIGIRSVQITPEGSRE